MKDDLFLQSPVFPAGTLLDSYYDRDVTQLSDRGLASNLIGDRWSELSDDFLSTWPGTTLVLPDGSDIHVETVVRLDDEPRLASLASRKKLQNPDFIVIGTRDNERQQFAVDAKFSIDTARSSQVASDTLDALMDLLGSVPDLIPGLPSGARSADGYFLSPDSPLTSWVLSRKRGRMAARVPSTHVVLTPVSPVSFLKPMEGSRLISPLATLDGFRQEIRSNLLLAMYYFRLARACYGAYKECTEPIIGPSETGRGTTEELEQQTMHFARTRNTAWDVVLAWDANAEQVRATRRAVTAAMTFPVQSKELRERVLMEAEVRGVDAPSLNSVRKRLGSWHRHQFVDRLGVVLPPVSDLSSLLQRIHAISRDIDPMVEDAVDAAIHGAFESARSEIETA